MTDKRFSDMTFPEQLSAYESALSEASRLKAQLHEYSRKMVDAADEIIAWKDASGLECGGDPEAVTPQDLRKHLLGLTTFVEDLAEGDCSYGDGCPPRCRHGVCVSCQAREVLKKTGEK